MLLATLYMPTKNKSDTRICIRSKQNKCNCLTDIGVLRREGGAFPGPGPGSYKPLESMGRQPLSTQRNEVSVTFSLSAR